MHKHHKTRLFFTDRNLHSHNKRADKLLDQLFGSIPVILHFTEYPVKQDSDIVQFFSFSYDDFALVIGYGSAV